MAYDGAVGLLVIIVSQLSLYGTNFLVLICFFTGWTIWKDLDKLTVHFTKLRSWQKG